MLVGFTKIIFKKINKNKNRKEEEEEGKRNQASVPVLAWSRHQALGIRIKSL